ncbi:MAG: glycosyltransferase family 2 protein [Flavobacteriaceae bacterium]|nr:glycosyltransferase family 2 protein [Flavobacteriaceae bacterium]
MLRELIPTFKGEIDYHPDYTFTVFTPLFNRQDTIERVYDSLEAQTFRDFEWVIINDGSTDNSNEKVLELIDRASFDVQYRNNTVNQHKMACFIEAIALAKGEFILILDSDDECLPKALEILKNSYEDLPENIKPKCSGVTGLDINSKGEVVGDTYQSSPFYSDTFDSSYIHNIRGDKWGFTKSSILKGIDFNSDLFGKGLIPEGLIWNLIAESGYLTAYINENLLMSHTDSDDRLSIPDHSKNALGAAIFSIAIINWFWKKYLSARPMIFAKRLYALLRSSNFLEYSKAEYSAAIDNGFIRLVFNILWPLRGLFKK